VSRAAKRQPRLPGGKSARMHRDKKKYKEAYCLESAPQGTKGRYKTYVIHVGENTSFTKKKKKKCQRNFQKSQGDTVVKKGRRNAGH